MKIGESTIVPKLLEKSQDANLVFSKVISFSNLMDKAMFFDVSSLNSRKTSKERISS